MTCHAHDAAVHVDVLAGGHLGVEAGAYLKEGGDTAAVADVAGAGGGDVAEELQQGALSGSVLAYDAYHVALLYFERDVFQCPDVVRVSLCGAVVGLANLEIGVFFAQNAGLPPAVEVVAERACADTPQAVLFAYVVEFYCYVLFHALVCFVPQISRINTDILVKNSVSVVCVLSHRFHGLTRILPVRTSMIIVEYNWLL